MQSRPEAVQLERILCKRTIFVKDTCQQRKEVDIKDLHSFTFLGRYRWSSLATFFQVRLHRIIPGHLLTFQKSLVFFPKESKLICKQKSKKYMTLNLSSKFWIQISKFGIWIQIFEFKSRNFEFEFKFLNSNFWIQFLDFKFEYLGFESICLNSINNKKSMTFRRNIWLYLIKSKKKIKL